MAIKRTQEENNTSYFITFTCINWINLISESNSYEAFYIWFRYLKTIDVKVLSYVIMPNHFHAVFYLPLNCSKTINQIVANGKRFIAYDIIKNLEEDKNEKLLSILFGITSEREKIKGSKHKVFEISFDCKEMFNEQVLETKIDYIHKNPCMGKWNLATDFTLYEYSSASFYELGKENEFVTNYKDV